MADVYVNALTTISTEPTTTDSLVAVNRSTNEGKIIDYNLLADAILNKLTSKTYSGLNTTSKLLVGAINELDSDVSSLNSNLSGIKYIGRNVGGNNTAVTTYTISRADFNNASSGAYLITVITWSNAPTTDLYLVAFSGGVASYNTVARLSNNISGDARVTTSGTDITITGVHTIYALAHNL